MRVDDALEFSCRLPCFFPVSADAFDEGLARLVSDKVHLAGCGTYARAAREKIEAEQMTYYYPDVVVYFYFTSNPKCGQKLPHASWDVMSGTLAGIDVSLRHARSV
jgi:hypothetical protein